MNLSIDKLKARELDEVYTTSRRRHELSIIDNYKAWYLHPPRKKWDPEEFKRRSYEISTMDEIRNLVILNPDMELDEIIGTVLDDLSTSYESFETPTEVFEILSVFFETCEAFLDWKNRFES